MYRCAALIIALLFAGCSSSSTLPAGNIQATGALGAASGPFSAAYSGNYSLTACGPLHSHDGAFSFSGKGTATFFHHSLETGHMSAPSGVCSWSGSATLKSKLHPANTITVSLALQRPNRSPNNPCQTQGLDIHWAVTAGTGKFANGTGSGTLKFTCQSNGSYSDGWTGTLAF